MSQTAIEPIRVAVSVRCPVERAFEVFTEEASGWWPFEGHSIGEARTAAVVMEGRVGGRIYEVLDDGTEASWGTFGVWEPPHRIEFDWQPNPERPAPTYVIVTFTPEDDGTRVELEHRRWEVLGAAAAESRASYLAGWGHVLRLFSDAASR
jgi:uncharacterized protein YndB with AHSA1/START domain